MTDTGVASGGYRRNLGMGLPWVTLGYISPIDNMI
jgi:hypothetical protein